MRSTASCRWSSRSSRPAARSRSLHLAAPTTTTTTCWAASCSTRSASATSVWLSARPCARVTNTSARAGVVAEPRRSPPPPRARASTSQHPAPSGRRRRSAAGKISAGHWTGSSTRSIRTLLPRRPRRHPSAAPNSVTVAPSSPDQPGADASRIRARTPAASAASATASAMVDAPAPAVAARTRTRLARPETAFELIAVSRSGAGRSDVSRPPGVVATVHLTAGARGETAGGQSGSRGPELAGGVDRAGEAGRVGVSCSPGGFDPGGVDPGGSRSRTRAVRSRSASRSTPVGALSSTSRATDACRLRLAAARSPAPCRTARDRRCGRQPRPAAARRPRGSARRR